jgi:hypothetical protein
VQRHVTITGPGRPDVSAARARRITSPVRPAAVISSTRFVTEAKLEAALNIGATPCRSIACPSGSRSTGVESENAVATPA